MFKEDISA